VADRSASGDGSSAWVVIPSTDLASRVRLSRATLSDVSFAAVRLTSTNRLDSDRTFESKVRALVVLKA
jgi:hypothetical protein